MVLKDADSCSEISFLNFKTYIHFWANVGQKSKFPVLTENGHTEYFKDADLYSDISFLNLQL